MFNFKTFIIIVLSSVLLCDGRHLNGSIRPLNPILTKEGVNISCSLPSIQNLDGIVVSSKNLYFSPPDLTPSSPIVVDDTTINLTLSYMSRFHNHVNIFCYANVSGEQHYVAQSKIIVVEPLIAPTFKGCMVHNWMTMTCEIEPAEPDFGVKTYTEFLYSHMCLKKFYLCPSFQSGKCEISRGFQNFKYCFIVCFNNTYERTCTEMILVDSTTVVKPNPVTASYSASSRFADVVLVKPYPNNMTFYVEVERGGKTTLIKTNSTEVRLDRLRPNAIYSVKVKCIPLVRVNVESYVEMGNFSDPYSFNLKTHPDVPDENPQLLHGSFYFDSSTSSDGRTYVNIFWRKIPEESENGLLNHTGITYWEMGRDGDVRRENCDPNEVTTQLKWQMDRRKDYTLEVVISNEKGVNNNIPPSRIIIPSLKRAPKSPEHVYATLVNNSIQLKWSELKEIVGYTVYWCSLHHSTRKCHSNQNIEWKSDIPAETTELIIPVTSNNLDIKVGISVEKFDSEMNMIVSSGVTWSQCINKLVADVLPPTHFHFSPQQTPHSLTIMWNHPECPDTSYISGYEIFWCRVNSLENDNSTHCYKGNSSSVVLGSTTSWTIVDLEPSAEYEVTMRSRSFDRTSERVEGIKMKVLDSGYNRVMLIMIIIFGVLFVILGPIILITICRKLYKFFKQSENIIVPKFVDSGPGYYVQPYSDGIKQEARTGDQLNMNLIEPVVTNGTSSHSNISLYTKTSPLSPPIQSDRSYPVEDVASPNETVTLLRPLPSSSPPSSLQPLPSEVVPSNRPLIPDDHVAANVSSSSSLLLMCHGDGAGGVDNDKKKVYDDDDDDDVGYSEHGRVSIPLKRRVDKSYV